MSKSTYTVNEADLGREYPPPLVPQCELCGSLKNKRLGEEKGSNIYRCKKCSLVYVHPQPTPEYLARYYLQYDSTEKESNWQSFSEEVFRQAAERISKLRSGGKLLDIGCGYGFFMNLMEKRGWEVHGLEIDAKVARYAVEKLGLDVTEGDVLSYPRKDNEFDLITLWWVLEHLSQPLSVIKKCRDALKKDGILVFRVPNINFVAHANRLLSIEKSLKRIGISLSSLVNPLSRKEYLFELLGAPYHIFGYNRKTISDLMKQAGFSDFDIVLDGNIRTGKWLRDEIEKMLYATAKTIHWLSLKRLIFYYDLSVYAIKKS